MNILPLTYLGNIRWFSLLLSGNCVIDLGENYVKQSCRNRCEIYSANGVMPLTVNVVKGGSCKKKPVKDVRIDYSKRWQHQHWLSIVSAYKSSPYFDYYAEKFEPFYHKNYDFLADFNIDLLLLMFSLLEVTENPVFSHDYVVATTDDIDFRDCQFLSSESDSSAMQREYVQVFAESQPFVAGLSVLDLFMCEGKDAKELLKSLQIRL